MRLRLDGIVVETDDIQEVQIAQMRSRAPVYKVFALMKNGEQILLSTEYTLLNAVNIANNYKPNSFQIEGVK